MMTINNQYSASALYEGGWRSADRSGLRMAYDLTEAEADQLCDELAALEDERELDCEDAADVLSALDVDGVEDIVLVHGQSWVRQVHARGTWRGFSAQPGYWVGECCGVPVAASGLVAGREARTYWLIGGRWVMVYEAVSPVARAAIAAEEAWEAREAWAAQEGPVELAEEQERSSQSLQPIMDMLTALKAESMAESDPLGRSAADREIKAIAATLSAFGVKWSYRQDSAGKWIAACLPDSSCPA